MNKPYSATDPLTWTVCLDGDERQRLPTSYNPAVPAVDIEAGDALYDDGIRCWRGVVRRSIAVHGGERMVCFHFEDGGIYWVPLAHTFQVSETGLRGWSSGVASSAAYCGRSYV